MTTQTRNLLTFIRRRHFAICECGTSALNTDCDKRKSSTKAKKTPTTCIMVITLINLKEKY